MFKKLKIPSAVLLDFIFSQRCFEELFMAGRDAVYSGRKSGKFKRKVQHPS
jgi:hypothetical protein